MDTAARPAHRRRRLRPRLRGTGTTLVALLVDGTRVGVAHVGDSRAYLLRDGELHQLTHDHTLVQSLVDEGRITARRGRRTTRAGPCSCAPCRRAARPSRTCSRSRAGRRPVPRLLGRRDGGAGRRRDPGGPRRRRRARGRRRPAHRAGERRAAARTTSPASSPTSSTAPPSDAGGFLFGAAAEASSPLTAVRDAHAAVSGGPSARA